MCVRVLPFSITYIVLGLIAQYCVEIEMIVFAVYASGMISMICIVLFSFLKCANMDSCTFMLAFIVL